MNSIKFSIALPLLLMMALIPEASASAEPFEISGRYPHLTMYNSQAEVGQGAAVYWQDRLWVVTYSPHRPAGSDDKLHIIDDDLNMEIFEGSVGGTPANRLIHRESNQLFIGPYVIDEERNIRVIPKGDRPQDAVENRLFGRLTATARHLEDPTNKVYHFDMEGVLYEVDVNTLEVELLYVRPIPGWHAKGGYTGQGRLVLANNGERGAANPDRYGAFEYQIDPTRQSDEDVGALGDWDGADDWRLIKRHQFTEVTGPGGIHGAPDDDAAVWATGWDKRSLILMVMEEGKWHTYRLPKADYSYDGYHGWHTEWPRIREAVPGGGGQRPRLLMNKHGGFFDFPVTLTAGDTAGLRPIGSYLKIISDTQPWHDGRIVFACNETSRFSNPTAGRSQSNLWFADWQRLHELGQPVGWGGVWMEDPVEADTPSVPFLIGGYDQRVLHLAHDHDGAVTFHLEIDASGRGDWQTYAKVELAAKGYAFHTMDDDVEGQWLRVTADRDLAKGTAYFHFGPSRGAATDTEKFAALADVEDDETAYVRGMIRPRGEPLTSLNMLAHTVEPDGTVSGERHYEIDKDMVLRARFEDTGGADWLRARGAFEPEGTNAAPDRDVRISHDAASVIVSQGERRFRLPCGHTAYDTVWPGGHLRGVREVVTERALLNAHGTFFMLPRNNSGGVRAIKPIATHNKRIIDWCSWAGMMVIAGTAADADAGADPHFIRSDDGRAGLWFGDIDDLWQMGKPHGRGGPWHAIEVEAGEPSDPYLMTGYDRKRVELSHQAGEPVTFTLAVDVFGAINTPETYFTYRRITVPPGETVTHVFPDGFAAHWIRLTSDTSTEATATFIYE